MTDHRFQVDLRGIIDLLANHLYSSPRVYVRELLQNAVDAIAARRRIDPDHAGAIWIEIAEGQDGTPPTLTFEDNGIGLDEEEVHRFLATIGLSSKRDAIDDLRESFIGQFGIGILSCFMVADEIVMITRSARDGAPTLEWRGRDDGTYSLRRLGTEISPGTRVYIRARPDTEALLAREMVEGLVRHYGEFLSVPVKIRLPAGERTLNRGGIPWTRPFSSATERDDMTRDLCRELFRFDPLECIPLRAESGGVEGIAFVYPTEVSPAARNTHRVYHKGMLLSEASDNLLPPWAVFAKCVVNARDLRPTASRESFFEDEILDRTRRALGRCLRRHLVKLAEQAPERLRRLVGVHLVSLKALAVADDAFFRIAMDYLPFETSDGLMTMDEYCRRHEEILYAPTVEEFHQMSAVASAQDLCIVNAGRTYTAELLEKLDAMDSDVTVRTLDLGEMLVSFEEPTDAERQRAAPLMERAAAVLDTHRCQVDLRRFAPARLPVLLVLDHRGGFLRAIEQSKGAADALWASVMDSVAEGMAGARPILCLNLANPLIARLAGAEDGRVLSLAVEMLYIYGLLLGQQPLRAREVEMLSGGLLEIVQLAVDSADGGGR